MTDKMEVDEKIDTDNRSKNSLTVNWPDFDVDGYAKRYSGRVKIDRLLHIISVCPSTRKKAYEILVEEVRKGTDVNLYDRVTESAQRVLGQNKVKIDTNWMQQTQQENDKKTRHLEDEIQRWRNLSNREKICQAYIDAGKFYCQIGSYQTAISRFIEAKSYAGDSKLLLSINLRIINASIQSGNLSHVKSEANHALSSEEIYSDPKKRSKALVASGLFYMRSGRYGNAASNLLNAHYSLCNAWQEGVSGYDIALYGGLCSLASMNRKQLKSEVLDNSNFKRYLALKPNIEKLVRGFYESEYGSVMSGLESLKRELIMDPYLSHNVEQLLTAIRGKALVQYFSPYSAMDMKRMAKAFNVSLEQMEKDLSVSIASGHIKAKIDSHSKIIYATNINKRRELFQHVIQLGDEFSRDMRAILLRMSLQQNNIIVSQTRELMANMDMEMEQGGMLGNIMGGFQKKFMGGRRGKRG